MEDETSDNFRMKYFPQLELLEVPLINSLLVDRSKYANTPPEEI